MTSIPIRVVLQPIFFSFMEMVELKESRMNAVLTVTAFPPNGPNIAMWWGKGLACLNCFPYCHGRLGGWAGRRLLDCL